MPARAACSFSHPNLMLMLLGPSRPVQPIRQLTAGILNVKNASMAIT
jgi:hypothetical protein